VKVVRSNAERDLEMLKDAHGVFIDMILAQQLKDIERGVAAPNAVAVAGLAVRDRSRLKTALESVAHLNELVRDLLF
jgi:DNA polymerase-3 subunit epsilon/CBS domain-containing protein